jgi:hypothetical protein
VATGELETDIVRRGEDDKVEYDGVESDKVEATKLNPTELKTDKVEDTQS